MNAQILASTAEVEEGNLPATAEDVDLELGCSVHGTIARAKQHIPVGDALLLISSWWCQVNLCSTMLEVTMQASCIAHCCQ